MLDAPFLPERKLRHFVARDVSARRLLAILSPSCPWFAILPRCC